MIRLLVVDNHDSFVFNVVQLLREHPRVSYTLISEDELKGDEMLSHDALLLSPGPGLPHEFPRMMKLIQAGIGLYPMLGICLGHQALALSFGAKLRQLPHPLHGHAAELTHIDTQDSVVGQLPERSIVGRYHSWVVDEDSLPEELLPTAHTHAADHTRYELMALRHKTLPIYSVQFHPESMITEHGKLYIDGFINAVERHLHQSNQSSTT